MQRKKPSIFSTSITKDIKVREFNTSYNGQSAYFHKFHGGKVRHIKSYIPVHMDEEKPDDVVIVGGGNDLSGNTPILEIANEIMDAGVICRMKGASRVFVAGVLPRRDFYYQLKRHELNQLLKNLCIVNNFIFIANNNVVLDEHVSYDGVHLNYCGTKVLQENLLDHLHV